MGLCSGMSCVLCNFGSVSDKLVLCALHFAGWPKGVMLEEYVGCKVKPDARKIQEHLALTVRSRSAAGLAK